MDNFLSFDRAELGCLVLINSKMPTSVKVPSDCQSMISTARANWQGLAVGPQRLTATCGASANVISWDLAGIGEWVRLLHSTDGCGGWTGVI